MLNSMLAPLLAKRRWGIGVGVRASVRLPGLILFMTTIWVAPVHADGVITSSCVRTGAASACTTIWRTGLGGSGGVSLWTPRAEREAAETVERERLWLARCRPTLAYDQYGVGRYRYAASGCEHGRYE
jgi:hypothetical protein